MKNNLTTKHPTGTISSIVAAALVVLTSAGVDISAELAAAIVGLTAAIASYFTPR